MAKTKKDDKLVQTVIIEHDLRTDTVKMSLDGEIGRDKLINLLVTALHVAQSTDAGNAFENFKDTKSKRKKE